MRIDTYGKPVVVVTGAMGFIGCHLVGRLLMEGKFVIAIDNLCTGSWDNYNYDNQHVVFPFFADTCWSGIDAYLDECLPIQKFESIYYLASPASPVHYLKRPLETIYANTIGLENFLKIAQKHDCPILFTSTSEIYGDPEVMPQPETYHGNVDPMTDRSVYDEAKRLGETLMMTYYRQFGVKSKIVRLFNTYGPRMAKDDGRVVPTFICKALKNENLPIMGNGNQTRSFCYVNDTVNAMLKVMLQCPDGEAYNIGNPNEYYSISQIAGIILGLTKSSSAYEKIEFISQNDPKVRRPNITKIQQATGWTPVWNIIEGLDETIDFFKGNRESI